MAAEIARVLLVMQAGMSVLAALGVAAFRASAHLLWPSAHEAIAFGAAALLLVLALASTASPARLLIALIEITTLLGGLVRIFVAGPSTLTLVAVLTEYALPVVILVCVLRRAGTPDRTLSRRVLAGLLLMTGVVHLALAPEHMNPRLGLGLLFALDGLGLASLGVAVVVARGTWWRLPAMALLLATLAAYVLVVLRAQEPVDDLALTTKLVELTAVGMLMMPRSGPSPRRWRSLSATIGLVAAVVGTGSLTWAAELRAQRSLSSVSGHAMTSHVGTLLQTAPPATSEQQRAADALVDATRASISRYVDLSVALADGYRPSTPVGAPTVHYANPANRHAEILDPLHPQALVYATTPSGPWLLGAMYMMPNARTPGVAIGGALTEWHVHTNLCFSPIGAQLVGLQSPFETCPLGTINAPTPAMLHVWTAPNPTGAFGELDRTYLARLTAGRT